jgi:hypothetical protein
MATLSITTAWNETAAFARREAPLLYPIAFALIALPSALLQAMMPVAAPGEIPPAGAWLAMVPVALLTSLIGTLAITYLALRPGTSVGEALAVGVRRFLILVGAALLMGLALVLAMIPILLIVGVAAGTGGGPPSTALALVPLLAILPLIAFVWVRLMLMTPVTVAEPGGSIAVIRRSWALTRGHFWTLLGFVLLFVLVAMVASIAVSAVGGLIVYVIAGPPQPGSAPMIAVLLVAALLNSVISALFATFVARIYVQLADTGLADIFVQPSKGT